MFTKRISKLQNDFHTLGIDAAIVLNFENQFYLSGLKAITYSRPIVLGIDSATTHLIIPSLEEEHAKDKTAIENLYVYHETKLRSFEGESYLDYFTKLIDKFPKNGRIGIEFSSLPVILAKRSFEKGFHQVILEKNLEEMRDWKELG